MKMLKNGLMSALMLCSVSLCAQTMKDASAAEYELKDVRLKETVDGFKVKFPNAVCEAETSDSGLVVCNDETITFIGQPARFRVHFLDGKAVRVAIQKITPDATLKASGALIEKFGAPTVAKKQRNWHYTKTGMAIVSYDMWSWQTGQFELKTQPADSSVDDPNFTWGAIILVDHYLYDNVWWPRSKGEPVAKEADI